MSLLGSTPPPLLSLSSSSSSSPVSAFPAYRFDNKLFSLSSKIRNGVATTHYKPLLINIVIAKRSLTCKASTDANASVSDTPHEEASNESESENEEELDNLALEPKLQLKLEHKMKMKLSKNIRLRRKKLVRTRRLRKKGSWPSASKMIKNKN